ncbi:MAG: hypothetical protein H0T21_06100 [Gemmatimonadaceae bacterium]|nr:hypothetical protein [Gemmatimonadaceae bacterium]
MQRLRSALIEQLERPGSPTQELAALLREIGREARTNQVRPEQLIVIFKQLWNSLAETLRPQDTDQYEKIRQRLVTLCIQAYYAE